MTDLIRYEYRGPAAVITLNRPDKRNALSRELIAGLEDAFQRAANEPAVRVVVLTGAGTTFCAGMDLEELRQSLAAPRDIIWEDARRLARLLDMIYRLPKPTIAAVNGPAVAGGAGLVSVCDLAAAVPEAVFGYPEVRRGLVAAMVMPHLLRHVGERTARWLLLTGELMDAVDALRHRLINAVVSRDDLMPTIDEWVEKCVQGGPQALAKTKELLARLALHAPSLEELAAGSAEPRLGDECRAGLEAFFAKQPPPWAGPTLYAHPDKDSQR